VHLYKSKCVFPNEQTLASVSSSLDAPTPYMAVPQDHSPGALSDGGLKVPLKMGVNNDTRQRLLSAVGGGLAVLLNDSQLVLVYCEACSGGSEEGLVDDVSRGHLLLGQQPEDLFMFQAKK